MPDQDTCCNLGAGDLQSLPPSDIHGKSYPPFTLSLPHIVSFFHAHMQHCFIRTVKLHLLRKLILRKLGEQDKKKKGEVVKAGG